MDISVFLARLYGGLYVIMGFLSLKTGLLGKTIKRTDYTYFTVSTGYVSLLMGLVTVILHNLWVADWRVAITIFGWSTLIKGIQKTGFPEHINKQAQMFKKRQKLESAVIILLGLFLLIMSVI